MVRAILVDLVEEPAGSVCEAAGTGRGRASLSSRLPGQHSGRGLSRLHCASTVKPTPSAPGLDLLNVTVNLDPVGSLGAFTTLVMEMAPARRSMEGS